MENSLKRRLVVVLLVILSGFSLLGCRNNSDIDNSGGLGGTAPQQDYFYVAEVIPFPDLPAGFEDIRNITLAGDTVYFSASEKRVAHFVGAEPFRSDAIFAMTIDGTNLIKLPEYSVETPPPEADSGGLFIGAMYADGRGSIWVVEIGRYYAYVSEETEDIRDAGSRRTIRKLDSNGAELLSADISDIVGGIDGFYTSMFMVDDDGIIYIGCDYVFDDDTTIYVMDSSFNILFELSATVWYNSFVLTSDGSVAFGRQLNNERFLQKIDVPGKSWGDSNHLPENAYTVFSGADDFHLIYMDSAGLYGKSDDSGEVVRILNWIDSGIVSDGLDNVSFLNDGRIFLTKSTPIHGSWDNKYELIFLTKTESFGDEQREGLAEKTELTLGTLEMNPPLQKAILQFNSTSSTHYIIVIDYSSGTMPDDIDGAVLRFSTEITTGTIPDILILSGMPIDRLIALDLLVDLYPYLDADPELSRDSLMESVLIAHERNEKLYLINQTFSVATVIGNPLKLGEYPGWTIEEFIAVLDANPQADIPFGPHFTKHDFLWVFLFANMNEYVDTSSRTADFNNRDFIELLEFINTFPSEVGEFILDPFYDRELKAEGRQIMEHYFARLHSLHTQKESFGGEIVFKGWPTSDRNGHRFISHDSVAITSSAADKDGAWDFVRTLLMEEHQRDYFVNFPINKAAFNEQMLEYMEPYSYYHGEVLITVEPTQEDVDDIISLINSTTKIIAVGSDLTLWNIITESASDFFNGLISAEDAARIIQSRVSIFLAEQG